MAIVKCSYHWVSQKSLFRANVKHCRKITTEYSEISIDLGDQSPNECICSTAPAAMAQGTSWQVVEDIVVARKSGSLWQSLFKMVMKARHDNDVMWESPL